MTQDNCGKQDSQGQDKAVTQPALLRESAALPGTGGKERDGNAHDCHRRRPPVLRPGLHHGSAGRRTDRGNGA